MRNKKVKRHSKAATKIRRKVSDLKAAGGQEFFIGGSEMGERINAFDWTKTPLGPIETWPQSLKTAVTLCLGSRFPTVIWWNRQELIQIYNDAYIPFLGTGKHPTFLGRSGRECWKEIWSTMGPLWEKVFSTGNADWYEDFLYLINRNVPKEEIYVTFSYGAIRGQTGTVDGLFCSCYETTGKIVGARRLETLRKLGEQSIEVDSIIDIRKKASSILDENLYDIPFNRIYLLDSNGRLPAETIAPQTLAVALKTRRPAYAKELNLSGGAWPETITQAVAVPLFSSTHDIRGIILLGVSPRRPLDAEYRAFFDLIASHVSTAIANTRAFEEERKRAEALAEINRAKTAFFSNISHEFRTPLTLMLGPLEELLSRDHTELPPAAKGQLEITHRNSLRLLRLVNTLLDFSRIEAGRVKAVFEPTDLAAFTTDLASVFRAATERAGLRLVVDCPALSKPVYVDREMWEKIVLNLISNAFKFTFEGEIAVTLKTKAKAAELRVRDTGVGIPAEEIPRIFERFYRASNMKSRTHEGSGIGLALVKELVKLHGGSVHVESQLGEGTIFIVSIPLGKAHLPAEQVNGNRTLASTSAGAAPFVDEALRWLPNDKPTEDAEPLPQEEFLPGPCPLGKADENLPRLIVAEDNADMREYLSRLLSERYQVQTVPDGQAALAAAREYPPDLILSDIMMPKLDGVGLVRELRADASLKTVPVILLSARAGEESHIESLQEGADDYLVKPFSARELLARVTAHLAMARMRKDSAEAIRKSEERLRLTLQASEVGTFEVDLSTGAGRWNSVEYELLGLKPGDVPAGPEMFFRFVHPQDVAELRAQWEEATRTGIFNAEFRVIRADGKHRWLAGRGQFVFAEAADAGGAPGKRSPLQFLGVNFDITERKLAEEELRRKQSELQALFDHSNLSLVLFEAKPPYTVLAHNQYYQKLWAEPFKSQGLLGKNILDYVPGAEIQGVKAIYDEVVKTRKAKNLIDFPYEGMPEGKTWWNWHLSPIIQDGKVIALAHIGINVTERHLVEEALRESEEQFRTLIKASSDVVYRMSADWNEMHYLVGRDFIADTNEPSKTWLEKYIHPDDRKRVIEIIKKAIDAKSIFELEHRVLRVDSSTGWAFSRAIPILDAAGEITDWFGMASDITERKNYEERINNLNLLLDTMTSSTKFIIAAIDRDYRFTYFNKEHKDNIKRITGKDNRIGMSIKELFSELPEQQKIALELWERALNGEAVEQIIEFGPKHYERFYKIRYVPILDEEGKVTGAGEVSNDITEIKKTEEALRESEEQYRLLFERILNGFAYCQMLFDEQGHPDDFVYIAVNDSFGKLTGLKNVIGKRVTQIFPQIKELNPELFGIYGRVASTGNPEGFEIDFKPLGRCLSVSVYSIKKGYFIAIFDDITERKQAEEILKRDKETFERLVEERTAQLIEAQVELERARRLSDIGVLAATVAHELRNPLAAIGMAAQNIKRKANNPNFDKHLTNIDKKVAESDQIINNLLFYSRLKPPQFEKVDVFNILEESIESAEDKSKKGISIIRNMDSLKNISIEADPFQIKEVFTNILNNAHDAVDEDKGEIKIFSDVDDEYITICTEDNGPGIAGDIIDRVFDPFFTTKAKGTGLGLAVCKQIISMHEGEIGVKHGITKGTGIVVRLPKERKRGLKENLNH